MIKEYAMEWAKVLRSGKFKQGNGTLRKFDEFCCLGVLCEITGTRSNLSEDDYDKECGYYEYGKRKDMTALPLEVKEKVGMYSVEGKNRKPRRKSLTNLNDNGRSFKYIANYIEKYWEDL